jgi:hypothetical protein
MASGDVNVQTLTINAGAITLTGSATGSGIYLIECEGNVNGDELTTINGGSGYAMITLRPGTAGEYFVLRNDNSTIFLKEQLDFAPQSVRDFITLRANSDGSLWREEDRGRFPV